MFDAECMEQSLLYNRKLHRQTAVMKAKREESNPDFDVSFAQSMILSLLRIFQPLTPLTETLQCYT